MVAESSGQRNPSWGACERHCYPLLSCSASLSTAREPQQSRAEQPRRLAQQRRTRCCSEQMSPVDAAVRCVRASAVGVVVVLPLLACFGLSRLLCTIRSVLRALLVRPRPLHTHASLSPLCSAPFCHTLSLSAQRAPHRITTHPADTAAAPPQQPSQQPIAPAALSVRSSTASHQHTHGVQAIRANERVRTAPRAKPHPAPPIPSPRPRPEHNAAAAASIHRPRLSSPQTQSSSRLFFPLSLFFAQRPSPPPFCDCSDRTLRDERAEGTAGLTRCLFVRVALLWFVLLRHLID